MGSAALKRYSPWTAQTPAIRRWEGQPSATITSTPSKRSARPPVGCPLRLAAAQRASQTSPHAQAAAAFTVQSLSSYATQRSTRATTLIILLSLNRAEFLRSGATNLASQTAARLFCPTSTTEAERPFTSANTKVFVRYSEQRRYFLYPPPISAWASTRPRSQPTHSSSRPRQISRVSWPVILCRTTQPALWGQHLRYLVQSRHQCESVLSSHRSSDLPEIAPYSKIQLQQLIRPNHQP
jgi:hypothetical protein